MGWLKGANERLQGRKEENIERDRRERNEERRSKSCCCCCCCCRCCCCCCYSLLTTSLCRSTDLKRSTTMIFSKPMSNTNRLLTSFTSRNRITFCFTAFNNTSFCFSFFCSGGRRKRRIKRRTFIHKMKSPFFISITSKTNINRSITFRTKKCLVILV